MKDNRHGEIDSNLYPVATAAVRDILYMYYDMAASYDGFGHNIEQGAFDPYFFLDCCLKELEGYTFGISLDLLNRGAAVALLCRLSDHWDDHEAAPAGELRARIGILLSEGRTDHLPLAKEALSLGLTDEKKFRKKLEEVYREYVLEFFRSLTGSAGPDRLEA